MQSLPTLSDHHTDPTKFPPGVAYMNEQYLPIREAKISVLDYGFLHSDATYDVVHVLEGAFFRLDGHLDRFFADPGELHMAIRYDAAQITDILIDARVNISEGPGFNIFAVTDDVVLTPEHSVLQGVTRQTIFNICKALGITCTAGDLGPLALKQADEVFVTSTAGGVMPVTRIDGAPIGTGTPGPRTAQITQRYWQMHHDKKHRLEVGYPETRAVFET